MLHENARVAESVGEPVAAESVLEGAFEAAPEPPPLPAIPAMAEAGVPAPQVPMESEPAYQPAPAAEDLPTPESIGLDIGPEPDFDPLGSVDTTATPDEEDLHALDDLDGPGDANDKNDSDDIPELDDLDEREDPDFSEIPDGDEDILPDVFARDDDRYQPSTVRRGRGRLAVSILSLLLITLGALGTAAWYWRVPIVKHYEQADVLYRFFGIHVDIPGLGLSFRDVTGERVLHGDVDTLVVRGFIVNISSISRVIPFVQLSLFDGTDQIIQSMAAQAPLTELAEGDTTGFRIQLENPSAAARRFKVDWATGALPTEISPKTEVQDAPET